MNKEVVGKIFGELLGLFISLFFLFYILPFLPFVTDKYSHWLPIAVSASIISTIFDATKFVVPNKYYKVFKGLGLVPDLYSTHMLVVIFPMDFSVIGFSILNELMFYVLWLSIVIMIINIVLLMFNFVKTICLSPVSTSL